MGVEVIRCILESVVPEVQPMHVLDVLESLPERGVLRDGGLRPVIVFGMEVEKELLRNMPGYPGEMAAAQQGVFYLSLPCSEELLSVLMERAKKYTVKVHGEGAGIHPKIILLLRSFKHVCENMKSSLRAQANSARLALKMNQNQALTSLNAFNDSVIARLSREYAAIRFWVEDMEKMELEEIDRIMGEIRQFVRNIQRIRETLLEDAVEMALQCAVEVENLMKILKQAVERFDHA